MHNKLFFLVCFPYCSSIAVSKLEPELQEIIKKEVELQRNMCTSTRDFEASYILLINIELRIMMMHRASTTCTLILLAWSSSEQLGSVPHTYTFYFLICLCLQQMWSVLCSLMQYCMVWETSDYRWLRSALTWCDWDF